MDYGQQLPEASKQSAIALTNFELVAATPGEQVRVASVFLHVDTDMTVTLKSSTTTVKFEAYPLAGGGLDLAFVGGQFRFETEVGESLTVTTSGAGEFFILVSYAIGSGT